MEIKSKEDFELFLTEISPYQQHQLCLLDWSNILRDSIVVEQYCEKCQKLRTFKCENGVFQPLVSNIICYQNVPGNEPTILKPHLYFLTMKLNCQHNCGEMHAITLKVTNNHVEKIGQSPSFVKNEIYNSLLKYKNIIPKFYPELTKAESCYSHGLGIPAFVYLRRILENLINEKFYQISQENLKFIEKIKMLEENEEIIPNDLECVKENIYSILSKGVHEYNEQECVKLYPSVKYIIECILDNELQKKQRKEKSKKAIQAINGKLLEEKDGKDGNAK